MNFSKKDLNFNTQYKWHRPRGDNLKITGSPDNDLLNRQEGYEVLYFIKQFMRKKKFKNPDHGKKAENMIVNYLPGHIRKRTDVEDWLNENWNRTEDELQLIKEGFEVLIEFLPADSIKKLNYIVEARDSTRREVLTEFIELEYDNIMEG